MSQKTSISDSSNYKDLCKNASENESVFNTFKNNKIYTEILEHVDYRTGIELINEIKKSNHFNENDIVNFKTNDLYGNPTKFQYEYPYEEISPSTIRYIKILSDLINTFGSLENFNIVEIGVGYGGQAKIIMDYFNVKEYNFIDLPEVNSLTEKYLSKFNYKNCNFLNFDNLPEKKYDLVISNYAFTECNKNIQDLYIEKVINKSSNGYIIGNQISHIFGVDSYNKNDLMTKIPNLEFHNEIPKTSQLNYLIIFKK
jgi:putative sugar O-methyltransferase